MNRTTALLLAMAALLAHALAVHLDATGRFGQPYEEAHGAYHLARNWVREGVVAWNVGAREAAAGGLGAHQSPLLVAVAAVAERLYLPVNRFCQTIGVLCALLTVACSTRFATDRLAGVIPALLLITSGVFAASAASGTELPLAALLLTTAFVASERRRPLILSVALAGLVLVRVEGLVAAAVVFAFVLVDRSRGMRGGRPPLAFSTALPAVVVAGLLFFAGDGGGRSLYGARLVELLPDGERCAGGLRYLWDFLVTAVMPFLLVVPLVAAVLGRLGGPGIRALLLTVVWTGLIVCEGGDLGPFTVALAPTLPLIAIAVQHGVLVGLDTLRPSLERLAWVLLIGCSLLAIVPSKFPGGVSLHWRWLEGGAATPPIGGRALRGRLALDAELLRTRDLRSLGGFLRANVDSRLSILSPWPGALGYLSGRAVHDFHQRTCAAPWARLRSHWPPVAPIDLVGALRREPDLILPGPMDGAPTDFGPGALGLDPALLELDVGPAGRERDALLRAALEHYELVTVPVTGERGARWGGFRPVRLLRRIDLDMAPRLEVDWSGSSLIVHSHSLPGMRFRGHPQLVELEVTGRDDRGRRWFLDPCGRWVGDGRVCTRVEIVLGTDGDRRVRLMATEITPTPDGHPIVEIRARLLNPRVHKQSRLAPASAEVRLP